MAVQIPDSFNVELAVPRARAVVRFARRLRRHRRRPSEWGLKHGCAVALTDAGKGVGLLRPDRRHGQPHRRHPRHAHRRRRAQQLRRRHHRRGARGVQRAVPEPARAEAGPFAAQPREGLGQRHARRGALRLLRAERPLRHGAEPGAVHRRQHAGDRRLGVERRRGGAARGRARHQRPDRRRRRRRAGRPRCRPRPATASSSAATR